MKELRIEASLKNLNEVLRFVDQELEGADCPMKFMMQIDLAVEEIFVNIAMYAYKPDKGDVTVCVEVSEEPVCVTITFRDHGIPYDPLAKEDPDVTISAEARRVGGLGIFLTKQVMDEITYEYKDGLNILKMKKAL